MCTTTIELDKPAGPTEGFMFVLNRVDVTCPLPFETAPGHNLQRASDNQIAAIREKLNLFKSGYTFSPHRLYETDDCSEDLEPSKMLYWVINFTGLPTEACNLQIAASLLGKPLRLDLVFTRVGNGLGLNWSPGSVFNFYSLAFFHEQGNLRVLTIEALETLRKNYDKIKKSQDNWAKVYKCAQRFKMLDEYSDYSDLKIIGYFSVIEAIITHAPELTEPMDSLRLPRFDGQRIGQDRV